MQLQNIHGDFINIDVNDYFHIGHDTGETKIIYKDKNGKTKTVKVQCPALKINNLLGL